MSAPVPTNLPLEIPVWPEGACPLRRPEESYLPRLTLYRPSPEHRSGPSVLILPGGGYAHLSIDKEGHRPAQFLASHGLAAAVLEYRHSPNRHPVPLLDTQRALRLLRQQAAELDLNTEAVGIMGFSAGGHLAGCAATQPQEAAATAGDAADALPAQPDFAILIYPVVTFLETCRHEGSLHHLLGEEPPPDLLSQLSIEKAVTPQTPPMFIAHGQADNPVPPENAIRLYQALTRHGCEATLHIYQRQPHGFGMGANHPWTRDLLEWLAER